MKKIISIFILCAFHIANCPAQTTASEKLVFALDLIRHGDRTPLSTYPKASYVWPEGPGQLTADGMRQEYELGQKMRKHYVNETHLLPKHYTSGSIYVRSTDFDRTLMSAQSLLLGLYPPGTGPIQISGRAALANAYQPIPIHTRPADQDNVFLPNNDKEKFKELMNNYVYSSPDWQQKTNALQEKFQLWSNLMGSNINSLLQLITLGDTLFIYQLHHIPLPKGMTESEAKNIIELGDWVSVTNLKPTEVGHALGNPLLQLISNYIYKATDSHDLKWVLLSAHDISLSIVASAMQSPLEHSPPYASDMNFELYEQTGQYKVKISFNHQPMKIPACGGDVCTLQQFMSLSE